MITTTRFDRVNKPAPLKAPAHDGPVATTPTIPLLQDAWSRAIARVLASKRAL
jgi:hypothetical protein